MKFVLFLAILLLLLIMWVRLDLKLGRHKYMRKVTDKTYPLHQGELSLFTNGHEFFNDYFQYIRNAETQIHVLFFIIKNDEISSEFFSLLKQKAREGVEVRLQVDWLGGFKVSKQIVRSLRENGISFSYSNTPKFPFFFYTLNRRNHRKITIIDGKVGYLGGFNVGREYLGRDPKMGFWRDYHLKIIGEGVADLQKQFNKDWYSATKEKLKDEPRKVKLNNDSIVLHRIVPSDGAFLKESFITMIKQAKREIYIGTPYFIPGKEIVNELLAAAERGVNINILVPMKADHPFVKEAAYPFFKPLLVAGCHIYRFYNGFYHAKVVAIDDDICDIGTANFDKRSFFINHEINCFIYDQKFNEQVKTTIKEDIQLAEPLTIDYFTKRSLLDQGKESFSTLINGFL
ncbi:cardiolipin synthase [Cytobacillus sp. IB215665]|uniref:cardiolipin synthase n=1 Tax=Cytobacillus sp. IB215665 TaxID=3097357 RepID=UPI002A13AD6F|nr:cardiolipin synthase [Cytobacillus sp. IB215665]MDX8363657.1 cardiolipin synthase [Cytobacillus sp. IB215665]